MDLIRAFSITESNILGNLRHKYYNRVVSAAKLWKRLVTGEESGELLRQFVLREDDKMFEQRKLLTELITSALCNSVKAPFKKVSRNTKVVKRIDVKNISKKETVETMLNRFYENNPDVSGLDEFLQTRFLELSVIDPNAWIVTEFDQFDYKTNVPQPRPFEVSSEMAINFSVVNGRTEWLLVRQEIDLVKLKVGVSKSDYYNATESRKAVLVTSYTGYKYTLYTEDVAIVYEQVNKILLPTGAGELIDLDEKKDGFMFTRQIYDMRIGFVPAIRVGYERDAWTDGATFVSILQPALPFLMKSIKSVSEHDLTMALHAFPQKVQYVQRCKGTSEMPCNSGKCLDNSTCTVCNGRGVLIASTTQDAVTLPLPEHPEDMFDLSGIIKYISPDPAIIKLQEEYVDKFESKVHKAIFNSTVFVQNTFAKTATEKELDMESIYDVLSPFARQVSKFWKFQARVAIVLSDVQEPDASVVHSFPADFKLKTVGILINEIKTINDSGAPSFVKDSISDDLAELVYADNPLDFKKYMVKKSFFPFSGKSQEEIDILLNTEYVTEFNKVLYANFEILFAESERDDRAFYFRSFDEQWRIIGEKVNLILDSISKGTADRFNAASDISRSDGSTDGRGRFSSGIITTTT